MEKFESQQYDDLAEEIKSEPDKEKRKEILAEAQGTDEYQEAKLENRNEKQPASWLEYFDEPYPESIQALIDKRGLENSEINTVLNSIVSEVPSIMHDVKNIEEKYKDILGEPNDDNVEDSIKKMKRTLQSKLEDEAIKVPHQNDSVQGIGEDINFSTMQDLTHLKYLYDSKEGPKSIANVIKYFLNKQFHYGGSHSEEIFELLDKLIQDGGADIFYVAPRSALYTANRVKGALNYLSKHNDDIASSHFTFPKSKSYYKLGTYQSHGYGGKFFEIEERSKERQQELKDLLTHYLVTSNENKKAELEESIRDVLWRKASDEADSDSKVEIEKSTINVDNVIDMIVDLKNIVERFIKKDKKEIRIAIFDESINTGNTSRSMGKVVEIVQSYIKQIYGVNVEFSTYAFHKDSGYYAYPSHIKTSRGGNSKFESFSKSETPVARRASAFSYDVASVVGNDYGFAYDTRRKLKKLGALPSYSN